MTLRFRHLADVVTAAALVWGVSVAPAVAQSHPRDGGLAPADKKAYMIVSGCLLSGSQILGGENQTYVLANPTATPMINVPQQACSADFEANALTLDDYRFGPIDDSMLGKWIQVEGRLEKEGNDRFDSLREFDVHSARLLPEAPPQVAAVIIEPAPAAPTPEPAPAVEPAPVATTGEAVELPKTAGFLPLTGLIGLFACGGGLILRALRQHN